MRTFKDVIDRSYARFLSRRMAIGEKEILVFDRLFDRETLSLLHQFTRELQYTWQATDSKAYLHSVRWKRDVPKKGWTLPFFSDIDRMVHALSQDPPQTLRRIYINFNLPGEVHYPHEDADRGVSAIYFPQMKWHLEWQGETVFFDEKEPVYVVAPQPGRLILFDASLTHRGSPPARDCFEPRINIAFKFEHHKKSKTARRSGAKKLPKFRFRVVRQRGPRRARRQ